MMSSCVGLLLSFFLSFFLTVFLIIFLSEFYMFFKSLTGPDFKRGTCKKVFNFFFFFQKKKGKSIQNIIVRLTPFNFVVNCVLGWN